MTASAIFFCVLISAQTPPITPQLTLVEHQVNIEVLGIAADVTTRRTYRYEGARGSTLTFTFPLTPRLDLLDVTLRIDGESAVLQPRFPLVPGRNRDACLVLPEMLPGSVLTLDVRYLETLVRMDGWYELVYPAVCGPGQLATTTRAGDSTGNPALIAVPAEDLLCSGRVLVYGSMPLGGLECLSHQCETVFEGRCSATMVPELACGRECRRDLVIRYSLVGDEEIPELYTFETPDGDLEFLVEEKGEEK